MAEKQSTSASAALLPVLLVNFIATLGFSIVLPFLVFVVTRFGGNGFVYGLVGATYPAMQLLGAPVLGALSDRYGRRRILLVSQAGTLVSWIVFAIACLLGSIWMVRPPSAGPAQVGLGLSQPCRIASQSRPAATIQKMLDRKSKILFIRCFICFIVFSKSASVSFNRLASI